MRNIIGSILVAASATLGTCVLQAQSVAVSLTGSLAGSTAYGYAETTTDYATGYYYEVCAYIDAWGEEDNGSWDYYDTSGNCGSTDAEVSWTFGLTGTTDFIQFGGEHDVEIDYYVYQMDESCGFDEYACEDYWDAYEASVLAGDSPGSGGSWVLYGPPAIGYSAELIELSTTYYAGTLCPYPLFETSVNLGYFDDGSEEDATFYAYFTSSGYPDYTGRQVREHVNITYEDCKADLGGPFPAVSNSNLFDSSTWTADSDEYGEDDVDYVGLTDSWVAYYQGQMGGGSGIFQCTAFWGSQAMSMSQCTIPSVFQQYDPGHTIGYVIFATHPDFGYRAGVTGAVY